MKNPFTFNMNTQNSDKKIGMQILKIGIITVVCFIASLFVSDLVHDRIQRNARAIESIQGMSKLQLAHTASYQEKAKGSEGSMNNIVFAQHDFFSSTTIDIKEVTHKRLGKQNIPVLKGSIALNGRFQGLDSASQYSTGDVSIFVPEGIVKGSEKLSINGKSITDYKITENGITIPEKIAVGIKPASPISLSYDFTALSELRSEYSLIDKRVEVRTNTSNIRLVNSLNSTFDKDQQIAVLDIRQGDYASGIVFLPGADDITLVDRILKYAILFIALVFALTLFIDLKKGLIINTLQYLLVGASLALFYLLTLALGEEIGYTYAYFIGAIGTSLLNMWYVAGIFNSKKAGYVFSLVLLTLYAILYVLVRLDSISLLVGTALLYAVLIMFMLASKKSNKVR